MTSSIWWRGRGDASIPADTRQAAVAVILRDRAGVAEVLFIKRAVIGSLPAQRPMSVRRTMLVQPFVFEIEGDPSFAPNHEVAVVVWTPAEPMYKGENHAVESPDGNAMQFNGFRLSGRHFVWGMTYRMVQTFFETVDPGYERRPEW